MYKLLKFAFAVLNSSFASEKIYQNSNDNIIVESNMFKAIVQHIFVKV